RREIELPQHDERVERGQLERGGLVLVERDDARFPVESRDLAALLASPLDGELLRLETGRGDQSAAFDATDAADQQRRETAGLPNGFHPVSIAVVLEAIGRVTDHEPLCAEKYLVGEIDARRQRFRRRIRRDGLERRKLWRGSDIRGGRDVRRRLGGLRPD